MRRYLEISPLEGPPSSKKKRNDKRLGDCSADPIFKIKKVLLRVETQTTKLSFRRERKKRQINVF
jgi:hypothetical protein